MVYGASKSFNRKSLLAAFCIFQKNLMILRREEYSLIGAGQHNGLIICRPLNCTKTFFYEYFICLGLFACVTTVMVFTMERYKVIRDPLASLHACGRKKSIKIVTSIWITLALYSTGVVFFILDYDNIGKPLKDASFLHCFPLYQNVFIQRGPEGTISTFISVPVIVSTQFNFVSSLSSLKYCATFN